MLMAKKQREKIDGRLGADVMFASDRTCCICQVPGRKIEIHHIDGDPSNNDFANLAVVCKDHQSDTHTDHAFARNLTPEVVRKYNDAWRAIVHARLSPGGDEAEATEYEQLVRLHIGLVPHRWKNYYMCLYPGHFNDRGSGPGSGGGSIWDVLAKVAVHRYSVNEWRKYLPLFDGGIEDVTSQFNRLLASHGEVVPVSMKMAILRMNSELDMQRSLYMQFPQLVAVLGDADVAFAARFRETLKALSSLGRVEGAMI